MNTINNIALIPSASPSLGWRSSSFTGTTESQRSAARPEVASQTPRSSTLNESAIRQYLERLAIAGTQTGSNLSRRALGAYSSVARLNERDYVSQVMGVDEFA